MNKQISKSDKLIRRSTRLLKWSTFFVVLGIVPLIVNALEFIASALAVLYIIVLLIIVLVTFFLILLNENFRKMFDVNSLDGLQQFVDSANKAFAYVVPVLGCLVLALSVAGIVTAARNCSGAGKTGRIVWGSVLIALCITEVTLFYFATGVLEL